MLHQEGTFLWRAPAPAVPKDVPYLQIPLDVQQPMTCLCEFSRSYWNLCTHSKLDIQFLFYCCFGHFSPSDKLLLFLLALLLYNWTLKHQIHPYAGYILCLR